MTYARRRAVFGGASAPGLPSRFLAELPSDVIDEDSRPAPGGRARAGRRRGRRRRPRRSPAPNAVAAAEVAAEAPSLPTRRRRRAPRVRRGRRDVGRAGRDRGRPLRQGRLGAQADGRVRAADAGASRRLRGPGHRRQGGRGARAREVAGEVEAVAAESGRPPGLATILVGDDPASAVYVGGKQKACAEVGHPAASTTVSPADAPQDEVAGAHRRSSTPTPAVSGILLPAAGARPPRRRVPHRPDRPEQGRRRPHAAQRRPAGAGPRGPAAVHADRRDAAARRGRGRARGRSRRSSSGARTCSASRWRSCCWRANATVTTCHSRTRDLPGVCRRADVLIAAVGRARDGPAATGSSPARP